MSISKVVWLLLVLAFVVGCGDDPAQSDPTRDLGPDLSDSGSDAQTDMGPDVCVYQNDCADSENCHEGVCIPATACEKLESWSDCLDTTTDYGAFAAIRTVCRGGYCRIACIHDDECASGESCTDFGQCKPFTGDVTGLNPGGTERKPLRAGVGNVPLDFPLGLSLAGFGSRRSSSEGQYAEDLYPSAGQMHRLFARAIALDNGERELLLIRLPIIFPTSYLHEAVARELQEYTGRDWRDSLVISATHTHSGPARYWPAPNDTVLPLGQLGTDSYLQESHDWLVRSTVQAAKDALDSRQDAKFGWSIVEAFDTDDRISGDRWSHSPPFDDNRLLILRIDDTQDRPIAAAVSFGTHAVFFESVYVTADASGGIERGLEDAIGREYGVFAPVLFFNESGGTMTARGGEFGHGGTERMEAIGQQFTERIWDDFQAVTTKTDIALDARTNRFKVDYDLLGYEVGEWSVVGSKSYEKTFWHGAINCNPGPDDQDYTTHGTGLDYFCFPIHTIMQNRPITFSNKSMMTALKLDDLSIVTVPGELSMEVGYQIVKAAYDELGIDWRSSFVFGYSQAHQFYITPTNLRGELPFFPGISLPMAPDDYPDFAISFLQGGYEPGLSLWGYGYGDYIVERAVDTLRFLETPPGADEAPWIQPIMFSPLAATDFLVLPTESARAGLMVTDLNGTVSRNAPVEFSWIGGDPAAEAPQAPLITLEREVSPGVFEPVIRPNQRTYDNSEFTMLTRFKQVGDEFEWIVYWEELPNFPVGQYQFRIKGHHETSAGAREAYETTTNTFELVPTTIEISSVTVVGNVLEATLSYPAVQQLRFIGDSDDQGRVEGSYRMRHPRVATGVAPPVEAGDIVLSGVEITMNSGGPAVVVPISAVTEETQNIGGRPTPVTRISLTHAAVSASTSIEIDATDVHRNTGSHVFTP